MNVFQDLNRIWSASGVVGPFAASATILALMLPALRAVIWFSSAAGMRMSQSTSRTSAFVMSVEPGKPWTVPCSFFQAMTRLMSSPSGLWMPPVESETATTVEPSSRDQRRGDRAGVAEALDRDPALVQVHPVVAGRLDDAVDRPARRGLVPALRAAEADRLAGHDARDRVARVHRVGVHQPGHDLGVRVDVRGGDVPLGADEDLDLGRRSGG